MQHEGANVYEQRQQEQQDASSDGLEQQKTPRGAVVARAVERDERVHAGDRHRREPRHLRRDGKRDAHARDGEPRQPGSGE